jgi:hypothetical protein
VHHFLDFHRNSPFEKVSGLAIWQLAEQPSEPPPPSICANGSFAFDYPARQFALILIKMPNFIHGQALSRATFYCEKIRPIFFRREIWTAARWLRNCSHLALPRHLKATQHEIMSLLAFAEIDTLPNMQSDLIAVLICNLGHRRGPFRKFHPV